MDEIPNGGLRRGAGRKLAAVNIRFIALKTERIRRDGVLACAAATRRCGADVGSSGQLKARHTTHRLKRRGASDELSARWLRCRGERRNRCGVALADSPPPTVVAHPEIAITRRITELHMKRKRSRARPRSMVSEAHSASSDATGAAHGGVNRIDEDERAGTDDTEPIQSGVVMAPGNSPSTSHQSTTV